MNETMNEAETEISVEMRLKKLEQLVHHHANLLQVLMSNMADIRFCLNLDNEGEEH